MLIAPCKDCPKKGCGVYHDKCPEFQEYKRKTDIEKNRRKEERKYEADYISMEVEKAIRRKKDKTRLKQR